jgi:hypothetical protein
LPEPKRHQNISIFESCFTLVKIKEPSQRRVLFAFQSRGYHQKNATPQP